MSAEKSKSPLSSIKIPKMPDVSKLSLSGLGSPLSSDKSFFDESITPAKLRDLLDKKNYPIAIGGENNLLEEILKNDIIVGCESMAMIIGLIAKRRVISAIPPQGKDCILPHPEIEHLKSFIHKH